MFKKGAALVPTWLAFAVTRLLEEHFPKLVDYAFTAEMEEVLDQIADGHAERLRVLTDFYFGSDDREGLHRLVPELGEIDARKLSTFEITDLDSLSTGAPKIVVRVGRYGTYVEDEEGRRANVADDLPPDELTVDLARELLSKPVGEERQLGLDPESSRVIVAKNGRFGPYVTEILDEDAPKGAKPRTGSLLASMSLEEVTLEQALQLMSLPRVLGTDADGVEITAQNGRYGPYLKKGTDSRSSSEDQIFSITLEEAQAIYAQPKQRGRAARQAATERSRPGPCLWAAHDHQGRPLRGLRHRRRDQRDVATGRRYRNDHRRTRRRAAGGETGQRTGTQEAPGQTEASGGSDHLDSETGREASGGEEGTRQNWLTPQDRGSS